jgi:hypothetical protein
MRKSVGARLGVVGMSQLPTHTITAPAANSNDVAAETLNARLGMGGMLPPWRTRRTSRAHVRPLPRDCDNLSRHGLHYALR